MILCGCRWTPDPGNQFSFNSLRGFQLGGETVSLMSGDRLWGAVLGLQLAPWDKKKSRNYLIGKLRDWAQGQQQPQQQ